MQCPECSSEHSRKNGKNRQGKQNHICVNCGRQFIEDYQPHQGYGDEIRRECLKMYVNGLGFRAIERIKVATLLPSHGRRNAPLPSAGVHHTTVINWVKNVGKLLPDAYEPETIPQVGELDEMEMRSALARRHLNSIQVNGRAFVGQKKQNLDLDSSRSF
jgi:transposase-like protein